MRIQSDSHPGTWYAVDPVRGTCTCPDSEYRRRRCKHIRKAQSMSVTDHVSIDEAFVAAQAEVGIALKDTRGQIGQQKYMYADLAAVWSACREALTNHGLGVMQLPGKFENGTLALTTMLIHKSGGRISETMSLPVPKADPQSCGSALTYGRRYALAAFLGIIQDDDDGASASHSNSPIGREESATVARNSNGGPTNGSRPTNGATALTADQQATILRITDNKPLTVGRVIGGSIQANNWQQKVAEFLHETGQTFESFAESLEYGKTGAKA